MPWYGWLVILALIALAVVYIVVKSKKAVRNFSGQAFGTNTIAEGLRQQKEMLAETPKSLKTMTGIFLPPGLKEIFLSSTMSITKKNPKIF